MREACGACPPAELGTDDHLGFLGRHHGVIAARERGLGGARRAFRIAGRLDHDVERKVGEQGRIGDDRDRAAFDRREDRAAAVAGLRVLRRVAGAPQRGLRARRVEIADQPDLQRGQTPCLRHEGRAELAGPDQRDPDDFGRGGHPAGVP